MYESSHHHSLLRLSLNIAAASAVLATGCWFPAHAAQNVNVVNTASNPVPTTVTNSPTVKIDNTTNTVKLGPNGNTVKIDSTANAVTVAGTASVKVVGSLNSPITVRDADNPAQEPFQKNVQLSIPDGQFGAEAEVDVPSGKRLVIEYMSCFFIGGVAPTNAFINTDVGGNPASWPITPGNNLNQTAGPLYSAAQLCRIYADPGSHVDLDIQRQTGSGISVMDVAISGYFVKVQ